MQEIYTAVKSQQILQPIGSVTGARSSTSSLSPHGTVLRSRSLRGGQQDRLTNLKRGSIRGLQSILAQSGNSPYGFDGRASPSPSFATSHEVSALLLLTLIGVNHDVGIAWFHHVDIGANPRLCIQFVSYDHP